MTLEEMLQMERKRKKKQKYDDEEHRIQCSCVKWFNLKYPKLKGRLFAVPNGGRRDTVTGGKLKAEGVTAGVSDLILLKSNRDYGALLIECQFACCTKFHTISPRRLQDNDNRWWEKSCSRQDRKRHHCYTRKAKRQ